MAVAFFVVLPLAPVSATTYILQGVPCAQPFAGSVGGSDGNVVQGAKDILCGPCDLVLVLVNASNMMIALSGTIAVLIFIYAGVLYLTVGYKPDNAGKAKSAVTYAVIGLVLIFGAYTIVSVVLMSFGGTASMNAFTTQYQNITGKPIKDWGVCNSKSIKVDEASGGTPIKTPAAPAPAPVTPAPNPYAPKPTPIQETAPPTTAESDQ